MSPFIITVQLNDFEKGNFYMQFYKNKDTLEIISGSRSHHFNKRRLAKMRDKYLMGGVTQTNDINNYVERNHIKMSDYASYFGTQITKHRLQFYLKRDADFKKDLKKSNAEGKGLAYAVREDDWIDDVIAGIKTLVMNRSVTTFDDFTNILFRVYDMNISTHDKNGRHRKFWNFERLSQKRPFEVSAKWFDERYAQRPAMTADNLLYAIKHSTMAGIRRGEEWLPKIMDRPTTFVLYGDYGANELKGLCYLTKHYQRRGSDLYSFKLVKNEKQAGQIIKSEPYRVIPIRFVRPVQRTVYRQFIERGMSAKEAKRLIKLNYLKHTLESDNPFTNRMLTNHGVPVYHYTVYGNKLKRMYQGLDWIMNNHTDEVENYSNAFEDDLSEEGVHKISSLAKIVNKQ